MTDSLMTLAYISQATQATTHSELMELLAQARRSNERFHITGFLIYCDGSFFQVVEGSKVDLDNLYDKLLGDSRHDDIRRILYRPIAAREFDDWSMAFRQFDHPDIIPVPGFSALLDTQTSDSVHNEAANSESEVHAMIHIFRQLFDAA